MTHGTRHDNGGADDQGSDERIKEEICEWLTGDPTMDFSAIRVAVKDGEVTLEGIVSERMHKYHAEDVIDNLPGVNEVHNRIRVQRGMESFLRDPGKSFPKGGRQESYLQPF